MHVCVRLCVYVLCERTRIRAEAHSRTRSCENTAAPKPTAPLSETSRDNDAIYHSFPPSFLHPSIPHPSISGL